MHPYIRKAGRKTCQAPAVGYTEQLLDSNTADSCGALLLCRLTHVLLIPQDENPSQIQRPRSWNSIPEGLDCLRCWC
jgi:hypothetical protein